MQRAIVFLIMLSLCFAIHIEFHLYPGWNLIAMPCTTANDTVANVLPVLSPVFIYNSLEHSYSMTYTFPPPNIGFFAISLADTVISIECGCVDFADTSSCDGCRWNSDCDGGDLTKFCQKATGDCDGCGHCATRPGACPDVWIPVCGCDGLTYSNECYAHSVGVNVAHNGECSK